MSILVYQSSEPSSLELVRNTLNSAEIPYTVIPSGGVSFYTGADCCQLYQIFVPPENAKEAHQLLVALDLTLR